MSDRSYPFIVVGAGPCGGAAAAELARLAGPHNVGLFGEEPHAPYERPPLSKAALRGRALDSISLFGGADGLTALGVDLHLGNRVVALDAGGKRIQTADGCSHGYGQLLLATGASARPLSLPGAVAGDVLYLRSHADAALIHDALHGGAKRVAVIGGGFIGLEVASTAAELGHRVIVIEAGERLMARAVPAIVSQAFLEKFEREGVNVLLARAVERVAHDTGARALLLDNGESIPADVIIAGIGAGPAAELARQAGLSVRDGIVVDGDGRTCDPAIFAAGDVAERPHQVVPGAPPVPLRLEAWEPALAQGLATARAMAGAPAGSMRAPWMWSDQFDWNLQTAGYGAFADQQVIRGDPATHSFTVFQLRERRLVGAVTVNAGAEMAQCLRFIGSDRELDVDQLCDPAIRLRTTLSAVIPTQASEEQW